MSTLNKNYIVEKSKPLIWAKFSEYNLGEMRLIDTYLAKINARNHESSEVVFSIDEYLKLLGYKYPDKVKSKDIEKSLDKLMSARINIDLNDNGDYIKINLFSDARVTVSNPDYFKRTITIDCNPKLKEAFFNLAETGYIKYKLDYSLRLKSKYAVRLYGLLKDNLYKRIWTVELKELRELLGATNKNNESFREFNKVLQNCQKNINSVTDIEFEYTKLTRGRLTRGIEFEIKKKNVKEDFVSSSFIENEDYEIVEEVIEEQVDFAKYQGHRHEYLMVRMKETNPSWDLNDAQADVLNDQIYKDLVLPKVELTTDFANITLVKMEMIDKVLQFAAAGNAKNLYSWLTTPAVWKNVVEKLG